MSNLYVQESYLAVGEDGEPGSMLGDTEIQESFTDNVGELYRALQAEHGRCIGYMYVDSKEGKSRKVGWVFVKRTKYQDCDKTYLQETWVHVFTAPPTVTREYHHSMVGRYPT